MVSPQALRSVDQFIGVGKNAAGQVAALFRVSTEMQAFCSTPEQMTRPPMTAAEINAEMGKIESGNGLRGERGQAQMEHYYVALQHLRAA